VAGKGAVMINRVVAFGLIGVCMLAAPARAGDFFSDFLPLFNTRPSLSSKVIVSDTCWRTCAAECGAVFHVCGKAHPLNRCRTQNDACDLDCLKTCRTYGGPLLDITNSD
jgi:hypothetical protein